MDVGIFSISDKINLKKSYITESDCLLGWTERDLYINNVRYRDTIGIRIKPGSGFIEIGRKGNRELKVVAKKRMIQVRIDLMRASDAIDVNIQYDENF